MIDSFKNFERLRYRLSNDMKNLVADSKGKSDDMREQISNTVFATVFSAFVTEMAFSSDDTSFNFLTILCQIALFCGIYILAYIGYNFIYIKIVEQWQKRKVNTLNTGTRMMIQIQKDFDNIACDSIIVAKGYEDLFSRLVNNSQNKNLRTFYYYEIMHYINAACEITVELIENKSQCIRTMQEATGVDIYRVLNIKDIMEEIVTFLDNEFTNICGGSSQESTINYQLEQVKKQIKYIKDNI